MNTIDRYILREWLKIFGLVVGATIGLLFLQELYESFRDLLNLGAGVPDVVYYYLVKMPSYLSVVLPIALLLSLLYCLGLLHRNNEIVALRAAGLGLFRLTRGIWVMGILFCGLSWLLNAKVIPWSVEESRTLWENLQFRHEAKTTAGDRVGLVYSVAFDNHQEGRMWFIDRYSEFTRTAYGVSVSQLDARRRETERLLASSARYDAAARSWVFRDGRQLWFDPGTGELMRSQPFQELAEKNFHEDPALMLLIDRDPGDLSFTELARVTRHFEAESNPRLPQYAVRYEGLLADTLGSLIIIGIAIPFAISGVRVSPVVGVSKSIGLFFLYYILVSFVTMFGAKGFIDPLVAAWAPNLAMLGVAGWLFAKMR